MYNVSLCNADLEMTGKKYTIISYIIFESNDYILNY